MRALASKGVLKHRRDGRFALTSIGQALRSDVPGSVRDMILFVGYPSHREVWRNPAGGPCPRAYVAQRLPAMTVDQTPSIDLKSHYPHDLNPFGKDGDAAGS